jgi:hypothetical protein
MAATYLRISKYAAVLVTTIDRRCVNFIEIFAQLRNVLVMFERTVRYYNMKFYARSTDSCLYQYAVIFLLHEKETNCETSGSHCGEYEDDSLSEHSTM